MSSVDISIPWAPGPDERLSVLVVPCPHHSDSPILKLCTFDGERVSVYGDGSYPQPEDFCQLVADEDAGTVEGLAEAGIVASSPHVEPASPDDAPRWRYRLRCSRPSCSTDIQVTAAKLRQAVYPVARHFWAIGTTEGVLPDSIDNMLHRFGA